MRNCTANLRSCASASSRTTGRATRVVAARAMQPKRLMEDNKSSNQPMSISVDELASVTGADGLRQQAVDYARKNTEGHPTFTAGDTRPYDDHPQSVGYQVPVHHGTVKDADYQNYRVIFEGGKITKKLPG